MTSTMSLQRSAARRVFGPEQWRIAVVAVMLHLALLLVPIARISMPEGPSILTIELYKPKPKARPILPEPDTSNPDAMEQVELSIPDPDQDAAESPALKPPSVLRQKYESFRPVINAAILLQQAKQLGLPPEAIKPSELGRTTNRYSGELEAEPILPLINTVFDDLYLPTETEIMDQWQDQSGTRHAVIRTPTGQTLCGRLEARDPLNPLIEPIAMYRLCAGGGKRQRRPASAR